MRLLWDGICEAIGLICAGDSLVFGAAWRSLWVSSLAVSLAGVVGVAIGSWLAIHKFLGRWLVILVCRAGMGIPTVLVGLLSYGVLSRRGPLGSLDMLYTPWAIVIGEFCLALPIVISLTHSAIASLDPRVRETAFTLGASPLRCWTTELSEARLGILLALLTAFARCITELGIAMMVGGNIKYRTRTLATATALETARGEFSRGTAMSLILLLLAMIAMAIIGWVSRTEKAQ